MIADPLEWKYPGSQGRRLLSDKVLVSISYGSGIFRVREIEVGSEREKCGISIINKRKLKIWES